MADLADMANEIEGEHLARGLARAVAPIPAGAPGWCAECSDFSPRLITGRCAFCRDGRLPPDDWEPPKPPATMTRPVSPALPEETSMPARTITLPGDCVAAIDALDRKIAEGLTVGRAAAELIELGALPPASPQVALEDVHLDALLAEMKRRFDLLGRGGELLDTVIAERDAAITERDAVHARLDRITQALAA